MVETSGFNPNGHQAAPPGIWLGKGEALGVPCFLLDFIEGESLLEPMLAGERWAEELYIMWHWVRVTGKPFVHYTAENLQASLERWLAATRTDQPPR